MFSYIWREKRILVALGLMLLLSGCATHDGFDKNYDGSIEPYGFFSGLWHGYIFPVVFVMDMGLFALSVLIYICMTIWCAWHGLPAGPFVDLSELVKFLGEPNTGLFYYVGFLIGLSNGIGSGNAASR